MTELLLMLSANGYTVNGEGLKIRFSKIKEHSEGYSAYVVISVDLPGYGKGEIFEGRFQLQGPRARGDVVKECEKRIPSLDWTNIITRACRLVMDAEEEGDPVINLASLIPVTPRPYILKPLMRDGETTLLFGKSGVGKSKLALAFAATIKTESHRLGLDPLDTGEIMYVDYEDTEETLADRLDQIANGLSLAHAPIILYKHARASLPNMVDALRREIERHNVTGMIVDSAALACGAEPESADAANAYFRALRSLQLRWSLTIAHQPHSVNSDKRPFGSVFWQNNPRMIWNIQGAQEEGDATIYVGLWNTKSSNSMKQPPLGFKITHYENHIDIQNEQVRNISDFEQHLSQRDKLLAIVEAYPNGIQRELLYKESGLKDTSFRGVLKRLLDKQLLHDKNGRIYQGTQRAEDH